MDKNQPPLSTQASCVGHSHHDKRHFLARMHAHEQARQAFPRRLPRTLGGMLYRISQLTTLGSKPGLTKA
eukprot:scaffold271111_cov28-Tisochrysis_lutea.AAC.2